MAGIRIYFYVYVLYCAAKLSETKRMEATYIRSTRPATAKSAADGSRPGSGYTSNAYGGNAYGANRAASRPHTATTGASLSRPQTTKSLRSGSGESGLGASASDGEQEAAGGGARRDGASKLAQMQERTRQKAHVRHQVRHTTLCNVM